MILGLSVGPVLSKSPMNLCLSVRSCVHFLSQHFSQDWLISFLIFCMNLRANKSSKLAEHNFLEKMIAFAKTDQKGPNWSDLSVRPLWQHFFSGLAH